MKRSKTLKTAIAVILTLTACILLSGCNSAVNRKQNTAVVFDLNGGTYRSCTLPVTHYYEIHDGEQHVIFDPQDVSKKQVTRAGYDFVGWFTGSKSESGEITFDKQWNFASDKVTNAGVTLYAKWKKQGVYTYSICYADENGEAVVLGSYDVEAGQAFKSDYQHFADTRFGFTALPGFYDENGNEWDYSFVMPETPEGKNDVKIFVRYVEGFFAIVTDRASLENAVYKKSDIYLMADVDFEGATFNGFTATEGGLYSSKFVGNGHTIKNFVVKRAVVGQDKDIDTRQSYTASLFNSLKNASIEDVNFENVNFEIKSGSSKTAIIVISPIAVKSEGSVIRNVSFSGTYTVIADTSKVEGTGDFHVISGNNAFYLSKGAISTVENVSVVIGKAE